MFTFHIASADSAFSLEQLPVPGGCLQKPQAAHGEHDPSAAGEKQTD